MEIFSQTFREVTTVVREWTSQQVV